MGILLLDYPDLTQTPISPAAQEARMATLDAGFESDLRDAVLDEAERKLYDEPGNLAFQFLQAVNENFRDYARSNDYDLESIIETGQVTATDRSANRVSATLEWGDLSALFEFGVDPHTIEASEAEFLHFFWESKGIWVRAKQVNWGSETGGIPAARAIRGALNTFRFEAQGGEVTL